MASQFSNALNLFNITVKSSPTGADLVPIGDSSITGVPLRQCTIAELVAGSGAVMLQWSIVSINTLMAVNNGYLTSSGGTLNMTLPTVATLGQMIRISNIGGNFTIVQGTGQSINFGDDVTTVGAGGSISSTKVGDSLEIICINPNIGFQVLSSMGNLTFV